MQKRTYYLISDMNKKENIVIAKGSTNADLIKNFESTNETVDFLELLLVY
jgi:hypothetical protein